jgi:hypothetical protein
MTAQALVSFVACPLFTQLRYFHCSIMKPVGLFTTVELYQIYYMVGAAVNKRISPTSLTSLWNTG